MANNVGDATAVDPLAEGSLPSDALAEPRQRFGRLLAWFGWAHPPVALILASLAGQPLGYTGILVTLSVTLAAASQFAAAMGMTAPARHITAVATVGQTGVLIAALTGSLYQIDMHMYVFMAIGLLVGLADWRIFLSTTAAAAGHHLGLNIVAPHCVFPDGQDYARVLIHAAVVLMQAAALIPITRRIATLVLDTHAKERKARRALEQAAATDELRVSLDAEKERQAKMHALIADFRNQVDASAKANTEKTTEAEAVAATLLAISEDGEAKRTEVREAGDTVVRAMDEGTAATETLREAGHRIRENTDAGVDKVVAVVRQSDESAASVAALSERAQEVSNIVALITGVADKTNLLALNATIEAARAGEAGKGFAVVASEVKTLAHQSREAAETITARIEAMVATANDVAGVIRNIGTMAQAVEVSVQAIGEAVDGQAQALDDLANTIDAAGRATLSANSSVEALSATMQSGQDQANRITTLASDVSRLSSDTTVAIERFLSEVEAAQSAVQRTPSPAPAMAWRAAA